MTKWQMTILGRDAETCILFQSVNQHVMKWSGDKEERMIKIIYKSEAIRIQLRRRLQK